MHIFAGVIAFAILLSVLWDAFETVILPRHVRRTFRFAPYFFRTTWKAWSFFGRRIKAFKWREAYLSYFGPLSLLLLFGLWALAMVFAFALLQWADGSSVRVAGASIGFGADLYFSGTTFFTLGMGDITPVSAFARVFTVVEGGAGFGVLALMISYLPTLYSSFSQREMSISMLDARAGSPPTAAELLRRQSARGAFDGLDEYLRNWETWSAQLMETHLTYPFLCFFRSQHNNQSWVAAFAAILDTCALLIAYGEGEIKRQAQFTFAMSRHAVADLSQVFNIRPNWPEPCRLTERDLQELRQIMRQCGVPGCSEVRDAKLHELRALYEPNLDGLSKLLMMPLPSWGVDIEAKKESVWDRISSPGPPVETPAHPGDRHF